MSLLTHCASRASWIFLFLSVLSGCAPLPKSSSSTLSLEEALDDELEATIDSEGDRLSDQTRATHKAALKRAHQKAKRASLSAARGAQLSPLSEDQEALAPYIKALQEGERVVALELSSSQGHLRCALAPSALSARVLSTLSAQALKVKRTQPGLWLSVEIPNLTNINLTDLKALSASSHAPASPALPLESEGGDWVAILHQEVLEALILEGPTPWLPPAAHLIGRCDPDEALSALTRLEVGRDHLPARPAKLTLTHIGWARSAAPTSP